jgi:hypothetical protein
MVGDKLRTYTLLSPLPHPKSHLSKVLVAALLGTHIPLLVLVLFLSARSPMDFWSTLIILAIVLLATIVGAAARFMYCTRFWRRFPWPRTLCKVTWNATRCPICQPASTTELAG